MKEVIIIPTSSTEKMSRESTVVHQVGPLGVQRLERTVGAAEKKVVKREGGVKGRTRKRKKRRI